MSERRPCCPLNTVTLLRLREQGQGPRRPTHTLRFDKMAEDRAAYYELEETACKLPASVRSTFLMAFSPDCTKVASTHGDHRIHVCEVSTGKLAHTLEGHPRTPWCLAFHPTSNHILASGCLAGQVRVWDLRGGSEVWTSPQGTVISSLAFHPWEPLLAIASANRVVLWHWRKGRALATCKTASDREKVRFVQFSGGTSLVTGITNLDPSSSSLAGMSGALQLDRPPMLGLVTRAGLDAPSAGNSSQRRSILTRLMSMYQHLEGLEERPSADKSTTRGNARVKSATKASARVKSTTKASARVKSTTKASARVKSATKVSARVKSTTKASARVKRNARLGCSRAPGLAGFLSPSLSSDAHSSTDSELGRCTLAPPIRVHSYTLAFRWLMVFASCTSQLPNHPISTTYAIAGNQPLREEGLLDEEEDPPPPSTSAASRLSGGSSPHSRHFWATFYRLRSICSRLERRMQQHQRSAGTTSGVGGELPAERTGRAGRSGGATSSAATSTTSLSASLCACAFLRSSSVGTSEGASGEGGGSSARGSGNPSGQEVSLSLVSLLTRLQLSLQSLSSAALTTAVAREQIHQVRMRITEILERLANVSGYRARLTSLRDQIYEAERMARRGEDEGSPSQHWDLAYCLWLVEMSLQLTRQMQRILAADYRLTQLHLSASSPSSPSSTSSSSPTSPRTNVAAAVPASTPRRGGGASGPSPRRLGGVFGPASLSTLPESPLGGGGLGAGLGVASTSSGIPVTPVSSSSRARSDLECPPLPRRRRQSYRDSSDSSDSSSFSESSDDESFNFARFPRIGSSRRWVRFREERLRDERLPMPEVHVSPPASPPPRPTRPVPLERPRSPPLPLILSYSGSSRAAQLAAEHPWGGGPGVTPTYVSMLYEGGFRPRLSVYETGPNLTHRIQCWDMTGPTLPDIGDAKACVVAPRCKIHNDASVALGGGLLCALVPCGLLGASLCVYSLAPHTLGQLLHTWNFGANAISVSLSPLARYLVVGFAATRGYFPHEREVVAQIFKLSPADTSASSSLSGLLQHVGNMSQQGGSQPPISLNSVRWLPRPGEGLIYGTNRGSLCICRPLKPISKEGSASTRNRSGPTRDATSPFVMLTDQVDRAARNTTIQVLSTASQTVLPQTQTTGTQTTLRGAGPFTDPGSNPGSSSVRPSNSSRFFMC
ncbi:unnamed protein product [Ixodes hexagonus]